MPSVPPKPKILLILAENGWKIEIFPVLHHFTWKLEFVVDTLSKIIGAFRYLS